MRRGNGAGRVRSVWNVVTIGLRQPYEIQHALAPIARIKAELVLQAYHVAGTVVRHLGGQAIGVGAGVVDDVDHARVVVAKLAVFWMAATEDTGSGAAKSTASAESRVNVAKPHASGGNVDRKRGRPVFTRHLLGFLPAQGRTVGCY